MPGGRVKGEVLSEGGGLGVAVLGLRISLLPRIWPLAMAALLRRPPPEGRMVGGVGPCLRPIETAVAVFRQL